MNHADLVRDSITPKDEAHWHQLRALDITSTKAPALFGISPYLTKFELWHEMKAAQAQAFEQNERMKWGNRLQDAIAKGVAEEQGWTIRKMTEYVRVPMLRIGSSFDVSIEAEAPGILEIKNVDALQFRDGWTVDGDLIEAPLHIELQVQFQMVVSLRRYAYIAALIGGNRVVLMRREIDPSIEQAIIEQSQAFIASLESNTPPEPDFEKDADFISSLYKFAEPGKVVETDDAEITSLAQQYRAFAETAKHADAQKSACKARLLTMIGDAEKVIGPGFSVSAGVVGPTRVEAFDRAAYRNFRINWKKEKVSG